MSIRRSRNASSVRSWLPRARVVSASMRATAASGNAARTWSSRRWVPVPRGASPGPWHSGQVAGSRVTSPHPWQMPRPRGWWSVRAMSHCGQRTVWPHAGHCTSVAKPRRLRRSITWPPPSSAQRMPAASRGLIAPRDRAPRSRRSTVITAGRCVPPTRPGSRHMVHSPRRQRAKVSRAGVAEPSTSGTPSARARHSATSRAW